MCVRVFVRVGVVVAVLFQGAIGAAWGGSDGMVEELRQAVEEGKKKKTATPELIDTLGKILDRSRVVPRRLLLVDTFSDGDYDRNPTWVVTSGDFRIDGTGALYSSPTRPEVLPMQEGGLGEREVVDADVQVIMGIVGMLAEGERKEKRSPKADKDTAVIQTPVNAPNAFRLRLVFRADSAQGQGEVGMFFDQDARSGYRLRLYADADRDRTMEIMRFDDDQRMESVAVFPGFGLGDGLSHEIIWQRADGGVMTVWLDGNAVLHAREGSFGRPFDGLVLVNHGGDIAYSHIELSSEK